MDELHFPSSRYTSYQGIYNKNNSTTNKLKKALIYHLRFNAIKMLKKVSLAYLTQVET